MKEVLLPLAGYNYWANQRMIMTLKKLTEEQLDQEIISSFSSIRDTVYHMWNAESVWKQRIDLVEQAQKPAEVFNGSFAEACDQWLETSKNILEWVQQANPVKLPATVAYYNSEKQYQKLTVIEILMHVFNHATYHRGQLVTMLRQVGVTKIQGTDYNEFARNRRS